MKCSLKNHMRKIFLVKNDFNQVKMNFEKKIGNSLTALNRKVIQKSNWLNAVYDSKVFSNKNVLDFFPTVLIKMESKCPQNKTIFLLLKWQCENGRVKCPVHPPGVWFYSLDTRCPYLPGKAPETNWLWPLSGGPWTPPKLVSLQTLLSPTSWLPVQVFLFLRSCPSHQTILSFLRETRANPETLALMSAPQSFMLREQFRDCPLLVTWPSLHPGITPALLT